MDCELHSMIDQITDPIPFFNFNHQSWHMMRNVNIPNHKNSKFSVWNAQGNPYWIKQIAW